MVVFPTHLILPHESPKSFIDGGVLEPKRLIVHHTSPRINRSSGQPKFGNIRSVI
jgi:hypothetical protein